jgi:putative DNA primase/helicase
MGRFVDRGEIENLNGIGFVFSADDSFMGIDLDKCRDSESGELTSEARTFIEKVDSYTEASPSGTGAHIIVRASIPTGRKTSSIEMYSHSRFFCFTGKRIHGELIKERQEIVEQLYKQIFGSFSEPVEIAASQVADPRLESVRNIPDAELLAIIAKREKDFEPLMQGDLSSLKNDTSQSAADFKLCSILGQYTRLDTLRVDHIFRNSALYRQKWDARNTGGTYGTRTMRKAFERLIKDKIPLYDPAQPASNGFRRFTDGSNTDKFIELTANTFAWVNHWDTWIKWNGTYWQRGADDEAFKSVRLVSDNLWEEYRENKEYKELAAWAKRSDNYAGQLNVERWARRRLGVSSHTLDQHPELLATKNGVVNLRTGELRAGERTDWLTRGVEWAYMPEAQCPIFDNFLREIMMQNEEMIAYLWRVIGYCLTGDTAARAFFILHGSGRNGKSTFARILQTLLGMRTENYAQTARFETFLQSQRNGGGADPDVAGLAGARVVVASEVNPGKDNRLDGARIKQFTGEDWIKARFLYSPEFQFLPVCKIFLVVNHIPQIDETAQALYDRLHYIPFNYRVPEKQQDGMLHWKLIGEMEGILAKAVQAAMEWYERTDLMPPAAVLRARQELAAEMDPWADFWAEECEISARVSIDHTTLYETFLRWCEQNKIRRPPSTISFSKIMKKRGFKHFRDNKGKNAWEGISLKEIMI